MDNSQQIVNLQNQISQEQTRHRNRMQSLKKSLENAKRANETFTLWHKMYEKFDKQGMNISQIRRCLEILMSDYNH